jgi:hypothetical protein
MLDFPNSAAKIRTRAVELVEFLKKSINNTNSRPEWTKQNFDSLEEFYKREALQCFPSEDGQQFRWDWVGYVKERGIFIAVESEWELWRNDPPKDYKFEHDFEKLLYVRSPLKLFMCRIDETINDISEAEAAAKRICARLKYLMETTCTYYSPAEVFIIYCVWYASKNGPNRDFPYILQIKGKPSYKRVGKNQRFLPVPA